MKKTLLVTLLMVGLVLPVSAVDPQVDRRSADELTKTVSGEFRHQWYVQLQGGAGYSVGEADFMDLVSPSAQAAFGCRFSRLLGARVSVSGWQARNKYNYPELGYSWNYVLPSLEMTLDVTSLLAGWKDGRLVSLNAFIGGGVPVGFGNHDAVRACRGNENFGFEKLWRDSKVFWAVRGGLSVDVRLSRNLTLGLEANADVLPDDFNSKVGKDDSFDWQFNCLVGLKYNFGR